jgi:hypothetical protein
MARTQRRAAMLNLAVLVAVSAGCLWGVRSLASLASPARPTWTRELQPLKLKLGAPSGTRVARPLRGEVPLGASETTKPTGASEKHARPVVHAKQQPAHNLGVTQLPPPALPSSAPSRPSDRAVVQCSDEPIARRVCRMWNVCLNVTAEVGAADRRHHRVVLFTGKPPAATALVCMPAQGLPNGTLCTGQPVAHVGR